MSIATLGETATRPGATPGRGAAPAAARSSARARLVSFAQKLGALVVVLAVWTWFAKGPGSSAGFPTPLLTLQTAFDLVPTSDFWGAVVSTVITAVSGFLISVIVGIPLGFLIGSSRRTMLSTNFLVDFGRTIPGTAVIPILLLEFGNTRTMAIGLVVFGAVWPLIIQATYAVQQASSQLRQVAKAFRLSPVERFRFVFAPSSLPFLMTGLRIAATVSLILAVTAEYFGQTGGIGLALFRMYEAHAPEKLFVYMFAAALLGVLLNILLVTVQRRALWWHPSERDKVRR
ncbi:ABC transporter permease [Nocardioides sp. Kera G14]|uniref:ABC transporter permease n=1 Tax=Nocardioides sp. Kera G14 TaxID=2884264 RepID=UPI001D0F551B|nr:ABC transporter permease subunit [Nocardioides sp. Kera G14]UDY24586.1 ABC transporter permease subunit [Nocardioides sp. Kera G14]